MCYSMRRALALALLMLMMTITPMPASAQGTGNSIVINEILVSVNNANYGGTDWNGDGSMGSYSDQYVELYNPTSEAIDIGGWYLDDIADEVHLLAASSGIQFLNRAAISHSFDLGHKLNSIIGMETQLEYSMVI